MLAVILFKCVTEKCHYKTVDIFACYNLDICNIPKRQYAFKHPFKSKKLVQNSQRSKKMCIISNNNHSNTDIHINLNNEMKSRDLLAKHTFHDNHSNF